MFELNMVHLFSLYQSTTPAQREEKVVLTTLEVTPECLRLMDELCSTAVRALGSGPNILSSGFASQATSQKPNLSPKEHGCVHNTAVV